MKDKLVRVLAEALLKVEKTYNGNVSQYGYYKPKKVQKELK